MRILNRWKNFLIQLPAVLLLVWPLWVYGYPLLYSDSGTYIIASFHNSVPIDRPVLYSHFVHPVLALAGLAWVPVLQATFTVFFAWLLLHRIVYPRAPFYTSALIMSLLALLTGLPHLLCEILPDFLSGSLWMLMLGLTFSEKLNRTEKILLVVFLLFAVGIHTSHLLILLVCLPLFFAIKHLLLKGSARVWLRLWVLIPAWVIVPLVNQWTDGRFYFSDSSRVFFVASLHTAGVLEPYLDAHCGEDHVPEFLCSQRETLRQISGNDMLWHGEFLYDSTCNEVGGWGFCWKKRNEELASFSSHWWKDTEALWRWVRYGGNATGRQLTDYEIGPITRQGEGSAPYSVLQNWPKELSRYEASAQFAGDLNFERERKWQAASIPVSLFLIVGMMLFALLRKQWTRKWTVFLLSALVFLLANAAVCGVLSGVLNRYQARVIWILPFLALVMIFAFLRPITGDRKNEKNHSIH